jgi:hypothetical protein
LDPTPIGEGVSTLFLATNNCVHRHTALYGEQLKEGPTK